VCRELTKKFEEVVRGTAAELAARFAEPPKGELALVVGPAREPRTAGEDVALAAVAELVEAGVPRRRAAELVSRVSGISRNRLYRGSL
jgi:16S rRNA (cytidine1402-2'-O)-methyltransferase